MNSYEKGSPEYEMMGDFFRLSKKFWNVKKADEYWTSLVEETDQFITKHEESTKGFSRKLGYQLLNQCEEMYKGVHECGY